MRNRRTMVDGSFVAWDKARSSASVLDVVTVSVAL